MQPNPISFRGLSQKPPSANEFDEESSQTPAEPDSQPDLRGECQELRQRLEAIPRATQNAAVRISELEKALLSIRQARDSNLSQVHLLTNKLEVAEGRAEELRLEHESMECAAELAEAGLEAAKRECEQLRGLLQTKEEQHIAAIADLENRLRQAEPAEDSGTQKRQAEQLEAARKRITKLEARLKQAEERHQQAHEESGARVEMAERERQAADGTVAEMRAQLEQLALERDRLRDDGEAREQVHSAEVAELEARLQEALARPATSAAEERLAEQLAMAHRKLAAVDAYFEKTQAQQKQANFTLVDKCTKANQGRRAAEEEARRAKKQAEELAAERQWLQHDLEEARVENGRLQAKLARSIPAPHGAQLEQQRQQIAELTAQLNATREELRVAWAVKLDTAAPLPVAPAEPAAPGTPLPEPIEGAAAQETLEKLDAILAVTLTAGDPAEALELLGTELREFAQRTLCAGSMATYRVLNVCGEVIQWLRKTPGKIPTMHGLLHDTFGKLARLAQGGGGPAGEDANASVYVVDDDLDNCECIAMALDKIGLRTCYASNAALALDHLASQPYDLIILDVDLGSADGFELSAKLREFPHLQDTPILFCSGTSCAGARVKALAPAPVDFLEKPYILCTLGLKVMGMIIGARAAEALPREAVTSAA